MLARLIIFGGLALASTAAVAQWWSPFAPRDYEDCAIASEKAETAPQARASRLLECDAKFTGRRKPGGGYTYYDFMQNRHFDIAGPNPTPEELKHFDEEYASFLEKERRKAIATALLEKQRQQAETAAANTTTGLVVASVPPRVMQAPAPPARASRTKPERCTNWLACTWTDVSARTKRLFVSSTEVRPPRPVPAQ